MTEYEKSLLKAINSKYENRKKFEFIRQDLQFIKALEELKETEIEIPEIEEVLGSEEVRHMARKNFKNLRIGNTFICGNRELLVLESDRCNCENCIFSDEEINCCELQSLDIIPECSGNFREDDKYVVFKEVGNDTSSKF